MKVGSREGQKEKELLVLGRVGGTQQGCSFPEDWEHSGHDGRWWGGSRGPGWRCVPPMGGVRETPPRGASRRENHPCILGWGWGKRDQRSPTKAAAMGEGWPLQSSLGCSDLSPHPAGPDGGGGRAQGLLLSSWVPTLPAQPACPCQCLCPPSPPREGRRLWAARQLPGQLLTLVGGLTPPTPGPPSFGGRCGPPAPGPCCLCTLLACATGSEGRSPSLLLADLLRGRQ